LKRVKTSNILVEAEVDDQLNKRYYIKKNWATKNIKIKRFVVIMHNPNVANEIKGDKSSNLCFNKAVDEGCNEIIILNLYTTRGPNSARLPKEDKIVEKDNLDTIEKVLDNNVHAILLAWGDNPGPMVKNDHFLSLLKKNMDKIKCFRINTSGEPCHASICGEESPIVPFDFMKYLVK
jgi:hypothetical protein